jgi:hypothetical protein
MGLDFGGGRLAEPRLPGAPHARLTACEIRRSARQPGCQCDRLCRARRAFCRSGCLGASGAAAAAGRGATSLNSRLASYLQQAIIHTRSSAERAEPGRAGAHPAPAAAQTAARPGFAAGLGSASLCRQAHCSACQTCQPSAAPPPYTAEIGRESASPASQMPSLPRHAPAGLQDKPITARRCQPPARRPLPGRSPTR